MLFWLFPHGGQKFATVEGGGKGGFEWEERVKGGWDEDDRFVRKKGKVWDLKRGNISHLIFAISSNSYHHY